MNEDIEGILRSILEAYVLRENSWDGKTYQMNLYKAYLEVALNDPLRAKALEVFGHWYNDVAWLAARFGFTTQRINEKLTIVQVPEPPGPDYHWQNGAWVK